MSSHWKQAGLTFLEYLSAATSHSRKVVKDSVFKTYAVREQVMFNRMSFKNGVPQNVGAFATPFLLFLF